MSIGSYECGLEGIAPVYSGEDDRTDDFLSLFKSKFKIRIISETDEELVADLMGIEAPFANALRRILLAEVPTVAIESVYIFKNTSIIQDEVLSHRLGLIPLKIDPRELEFLKPGDDPTDVNTVVMKMSATGKKEGPDNADADLVDSEQDFEGRYTKAFSSALVWEPQGSQTERFIEAPAPVHPDILVAKLAPGQVIDLGVHAVKGIGKDHAKFSPVATASYRQLPRITLSKDRPFLGVEADQLVQRCPMKVYDIEELADGTRKGYVARPRDCTLCRECLREPDWEKRINIERLSDHFIFSIESVGMLPARALFQEALRVLSEKCAVVLAAAEDEASLHVLDAAEAAKLTIAAMKTEADDLA